MSGRMSADVRELLAMYAPTGSVTTVQQVASHVGGVSVGGGAPLFMNTGMHLPSVGTWQRRAEECLSTASSLAGALGPNPVLFNPSSYHPHDSARFFDNFLSTNRKRKRVEDDDDDVATLSPPAKSAATTVTTCTSSSPQTPRTPRRFMDCVLVPLGSRGSTIHRHIVGDDESDDDICGLGVADHHPAATPRRDDRTPLQKLAALLDDIFEADDTRDPSAVLTGASSLSSLDASSASHPLSNDSPVYHSSEFIEPASGCITPNTLARVNKLIAAIGRRGVYRAGLNSPTKSPTRSTFPMSPTKCGTASPMKDAVLSSPTKQTSPTGIIGTSISALPQPYLARLLRILRRSFDGEADVDNVWNARVSFDLSGSATAPLHILTRALTRSRDAGAAAACVLEVLCLVGGSTSGGNAELFSEDLLGAALGTVKALLSGVIYPLVEAGLEVFQDLTSNVVADGKAGKKSKGKVLRTGAPTQAEQTLINVDGASTRINDRDDSVESGEDEEYDKNRCKGPAVDDDGMPSLLRLFLHGCAAGAYFVPNYPVAGASASTASVDPQCSFAASTLFSPTSQPLPTPATHRSLLSALYTSLAAALPRVRGVVETAGSGTSHSPVLGGMAGVNSAGSHVLTSGYTKMSESLVIQTVYLALGVLGVNEGEDTNVDDSFASFNVGNVATSNGRDPNTDPFSDNGGRGSLFLAARGKSDFKAVEASATSRKRGAGKGKASKRKGTATTAKIEDTPVTVNGGADVGHLKLDISLPTPADVARATFGVGALHGLRMEGVRLLRSIFAHHASQRAWIIEEILGSLIRLGGDATEGKPSAGNIKGSKSSASVNSGRPYTSSKVGGKTSPRVTRAGGGSVGIGNFFRLRDGRTMRTISALLLQLVQASAYDVKLAAQRIAARRREENVRLSTQESIFESIIFRHGVDSPRAKSADNKGHGSVKGNRSGADDRKIINDSDSLNRAEATLLRSALDGAQAAARTIVIFLAQRAGAGLNARNSTAGKTNQKSKGKARIGIDADAAEPRTHEAEYRALLDTLVNDALNVLYWPEWPAAALLLGVVVRYMIRALDDVGTSSDMGTTKSLALDTLGSIGARICTIELRTCSELRSVDEIISARGIQRQNVLTTQCRELGVLLAAHAEVVAHLDKRSEDEACESAKDLSAATLAHALSAGLMVVEEWLEDDEPAPKTHAGYIKDFAENAEDELNLRTPTKKRVHQKYSTPSEQLSPAKLGSPSKLQRRPGSSVVDLRTLADCLRAGMRDVWTESDSRDFVNRVSEMFGRGGNVFSDANKTGNLFGAQVKLFSKGLNDIFDIGSAAETARIDRCAEALGVVQSGLRPMFSPILAAVLQALGAPGVTVRAKALRALGQIVTADPAVLKAPNVRRTIESRLTDSSPQVRDAAVDLIGKYMIETPEVAGDYYMRIAERIADKGISVRKRVIKLLKSYYQTLDHMTRHLGADTTRDTKDCESNFASTIGATRDPTALQVDIAVRIVLRYMDDDDGVKALAVRTIEELWFPKPGEELRPVKEESRTRKEQRNASTKEQELAALRGCVAVIMGTTSSFKQAIDRRSPLEDILHRILAGSGGSASAGEQSHASDMGTHVRARSAAMCGVLIDSLVDVATDLPGFSVLSCVRTVQLLVAACPTVLSLDGVKTLLQCLDRVMSKEERATSADKTAERTLDEDRTGAAEEHATAENILRIFRLCLPSLPKTAGMFGQELQRVLQGMIIKPSLSSAGVTLLQESVACMCGVVIHLTHDYMRLVALLKSCNGRLQRVIKGSDRLQPVQVSQLTVLILVVSLLNEHCSFDQLQAGRPVLAAELNSVSTGSIIGHIYQCLLQVYRRFDDQRLRGNVLQCLGCLFRAQPMLMNKTSSMEVMDAIFDSDDDEIRGRLLRIIQEFLLSQASKHDAVERASEDTWDKPAVCTSVNMEELVGNTDGFADSGVASAVVQRYIEKILELALSRQASMQHAAIDILSFTVKQGLAHPLQSFPAVVALETSPHSLTMKRAGQLHAILHQKHASLINTRYLPCARMSFDYQKSICEGSVSGFRSEPGPVALLQKWYGFVCEKRQTKVEFLKALVKVFAEGSNRKTLQNDVDFARYMAENFSAFVYKNLEDVLLVIKSLTAVLSTTGMQVLEKLSPSHLLTQIRSLARDASSSVTSASVQETPCGVAAPAVSCSSDDNDDVLSLMRTSVIIAMILLLKAHLKALYGLSEDKCAKFVIGRKSAFGDRPSIRKHEKPLDWNRLPFAQKPLLTSEDMLAQKQTFLDIWSEDGLQAEPEDEFEV